MSANFLIIRPFTSKARNSTKSLVVFGTENLHHIIRECGAGQLVLGTDYPAGMGNINPIAHLLSVEELSAGDIEAVLGGTVKKLLRI